MNTTATDAETPEVPRGNHVPRIRDRHKLVPDYVEWGGFDATGEWNTGIPRPRFKHRLMIVGTENQWPGYGISFVSGGEKARKVYQGPLVPGPFAAPFGLSTMITRDPRHGTAADIERERAAGMVLDLKPGDVIEMGRSLFVVTINARRYPQLELIDWDYSDEDLDEKVALATMSGADRY